jgi:hypothetical protein
MIYLYSITGYWVLHYSTCPCAARPDGSGMWVWGRNEGSVCDVVWSWVRCGVVWGQRTGPGQQYSFFLRPWVRGVSMPVVHVCRVVSWSCRRIVSCRVVSCPGRVLAFRTRTGLGRRLGPAQPKEQAELLSFPCTYCSERARTRSAEVHVIVPATG